MMKMVSMQVHYSYPQKVLFKHCDPAGIVFYPRFFEMMNDAVEAMFSEVLDWPFEAMHPNSGVPTAAIEVQFTAPCRHGDQLNIEVTIEAIGNSSLTLTIRALGADGERFVAKQTLVCVGPEGRPAQWPDHVRQKINALREDQS